MHGLCSDVDFRRRQRQREARRREHLFHAAFTMTLPFFLGRR